MTHLYFKLAFSVGVTKVGYGHRQVKSPLAPLTQHPHTERDTQWLHRGCHCVSLVGYSFYLYSHFPSISVSFVIFCFCLIFTTININSLCTEALASSRPLTIVMLLGWPRMHVGNPSTCVTCMQHLEGYGQYKWWSISQMFNSLAFK